ncbi:MAG: TolC family protein [Deltaproteobacteria bacterium]|nr:TolC family protein [Deltaproteobacteria bacterium]
MCRRDSDGAKRLCFAFFWMLVCCFPCLCTADPIRTPLPEPLTLQRALALADEPDPALAEAQADLEGAEADRRLIESTLGIQASFSGNLRWIKPDPLAPDPSQNDSSLHFNIRKRLYDFGRSRYGLSAVRSEIEASEWLYEDARQQRRIEIMVRFLEVLLADMEYDRDSEAAAVAYARYDRLRDRNELGQVSDIDLQQAASEYRKARRDRAVSQAPQRTRRALLAEVLNRPGELPVTLVEPEFAGLDRDPPPVDDLIREALKMNPVLRALRSQVQAVQEKLKEDRAGRNPILTAEIHRAFYKRRFGSRDQWRADMLLEVPLLTGGTVEANEAEHLAERHRLEARLDRRSREVRQAVLERWEEIRTLRQGLVEARARVQYRDLYLDRSRSLYELEVKTDLGDAMTQNVAAFLHETRTKFELALAWARLAALTGKSAGFLKAESGSASPHKNRKD